MTAGSAADARDRQARRCATSSTASTVDTADGRTSRPGRPEHRRGVRAPRRCPERRTSTARMPRRPRAFEAWRDTTPSERQRRCCASPTRSRRAPTSSSPPSAQNTGKPLALTLSEEIPPMVDQIRFFAGAARLLEGRAAGEYMAGHTSFDPPRAGRRRAARSTPWNYPMMMAVWKFAPALAAGNTVVLKPSRHHAGHDAADGRDHRPSSCRPACSTSSAATATPAARSSSTRPRRWCRSPARCAPAWRSPAAAARDLKRVHLELGGKAPVVVFDDADLEAAAEGIAMAGYFNAGQDCTAATRVLAGARHPRRLRRRARRAGQARSPYDRPAGDEDVLLRAAQQRQPARPGDRRSSTGCPTTRRWPPAGTGSATAATSTSRPSSSGLQQDDEIVPERGLRPGHHRAAVHRRGRGGALGQRRRVRPGVLGVDPRPRPRDADGQAPRLRLRLDQHPHPAGRRDAARRLQALRATARTCRCTASRTTRASSTSWPTSTAEPAGRLPATCYVIGTARTGFVVGCVEPPAGSTVSPTVAAPLGEPVRTTAASPCAFGSNVPAEVAAPAAVDVPELVGVPARRVGQVGADEGGLLRAVRDHDGGAPAGGDRAGDGPRVAARSAPRTAPAAARASGRAVRPGLDEQPAEHQREHGDHRRGDRQPGRRWPTGAPEPRQARPDGAGRLLRRAGDLGQDARPAARAAARPRRRRPCRGGLRPARAPRPRQSGQLGQVRLERGALVRVQGVQRRTPRSAGAGPRSRLHPRPGCVGQRVPQPDQPVAQCVS